MEADPWEHIGDHGFWGGSSLALGGRRQGREQAHYSLQLSISWSLRWANSSFRVVGTLEPDRPDLRQAACRA